MIETQAICLRNNTRYEVFCTFNYATMKKLKFISMTMQYALSMKLA